MPTPHNSAKKGDFAKTVLMPGDPLRAKFIAETFLDEPKLVNNVRGVAFGRPRPPRERPACCNPVRRVWS